MLTSLFNGHLHCLRINDNAVCCVVIGQLTVHHQFAYNSRVFDVG